MQNQIILKSLELFNFKGIKHYALKADGGVSISADNKLGKTTLADGFFWLLFGKDSLNQADFEIKTKDKEGNVLHGIEHQVIGSFDVNGQNLILKKSYKEVYTKKRGTAKQEMTGHTTDHFINGVPVQKKEYDEKIKEIVDEKLFRQLTNPRHFSENISWTDRRKMLLELSPDNLSDEKIIALNPKLKKLDLDGKSVEDIKKILKSRETEINKELKSLPIRIDETNLAMVEIEGDKETIEEEIKDLVAQKEIKDDELHRVKNNT